MSNGVQGVLKSSTVIKRFSGNPVLAAKDVPNDATLIFNAGVTKYQGKYVMMFRNDYNYTKQGPFGFEGTNIGLAYSNDGILWEVQSKQCLRLEDKEIIRVYDPRLTAMDGKCYLCFAVDTHHGLRGGIAVTEDFEEFEVLSMSVPDNRNMVLFPERIDGKYVRLERPFPVYSRGGKDRFDIWISDSPDLQYWGNSKLLLTVEDVPFANDKIGPAAPPIKTGQGWLTTFHAVDLDPSRGKNGWEDVWKKRYTAGLMLLDLEDPSKIIGIYQEPLIAPETQYEKDGFRNDVIFPGGMILEDNGEVKIYYGAADTVECLASADVNDLINLCKRRRG